MKKMKTLLLFFLMTSCDKLTPPSKVDLGNPEQIKKIVAKGVRKSTLQERESGGSKIKCLPNSSDGYTGWEYDYHKRSPQISEISYYWKGRLLRSMKWAPNGQKIIRTDVDHSGYTTLTMWYENGEECNVTKFKDNLIVSSISYKKSGEICDRTKIENGTGCVILYDDDGKSGEFRFKNGKLTSRSAFPR